MSKGFIFYPNFYRLLSLILPPEAMKPAPSPEETAVLPGLPQHVGDSEAQPRPLLPRLGIRLLYWLAGFALYLGVVAVFVAIGVYFLRQIPVPQDIEQMFKNSGRSAPTKPLPLTSGHPASTAPGPSPSALVQPLANSVPVSPPLEKAAPIHPLADLSLTGTMHYGVSEPPSSSPSSTLSDIDTDPAVSSRQSVDDSTNLGDDLSRSVPGAAPVLPSSPISVQEEVAQLLTQARQQMDSRRLTAPADYNALRTYRRVLELDPNNAAAQSGIEQIVAYYRHAAEQSLRQGRPDESLAYIGRGLRAAPQDQELLNLRQRARLLQQQREQVQQEEVRRQYIRRELAEWEYQERLRQQSGQEQLLPWGRQPPAYESDTEGFNQR